MDLQFSVEDFHYKFGHPVEATPTLIPAERARLRYQLIGEELEEYADAALDGDLVGVADALADILYVVYGTAAEHGIHLAPVFDIVHDSNMSKLGEDGKPVPHPTIPGKIGKGPNYWEPRDMIENELKVQGALL